MSDAEMETKMETEMEALSNTNRMPEKTIITKRELVYNKCDKSKR